MVLLDCGVLRCILTGVMRTMGCIFKKSSASLVTNEYGIRESFRKISVRTVTADVIFVPGDGAEAKVVCHEKAEAKHRVAVEEDTLIIDGLSERKWYHNIGCRCKKAKVTIIIPKGEYHALNVKNTTGNVEIPGGFAFGNADISVTTGDISWRDSAVGDLDCKSTTGDVNLTDIQCDALIATGTTGDLKMRNVIAAGKMTIHRVCGHVEFEACDASEVSVRVTTGDVKGTLLSDKTFEAKSTTGKVEVPRSRPGGLCKVHTTTGRIDIDIQ